MTWRISRSNSTIKWQGYRVSASRLAESNFRYTQASKPLHRYNADEMGTSSGFQTATPDPDVADRKCEKSTNDGPCSGVADEKGVTGENTHVRTAKSKSDDLPYTGPPVAVPDEGP